MMLLLTLILVCLILILINVQLAKLICLTIIHPNIYFVVHGLSQFMHASKQSHLSAALKVLKYFKGDPSRGITFFKNSDFCLRAFCDSNWAACPITKKSVIGYCIFFGSSLIFYKSKKQSTVSRSSAEAEYQAMTQTCCEIIWIVGHFKDLQVFDFLPVTLACDNFAALQIAASPVLY